MTPEPGPPRHRLGMALIVALWAGAAVSFLVTAGRGTAAFHAGQGVSGLLIVVAGALVARDWLGVATAMGQRSARRWRGRVVAPEASNPAVAARSQRLLAWWWIGFGVLILLLAVASPR
ncbi:MAG TPA: hypothetical protein VFC09_10920 [Candidatus Dormibacteraeota bacterium]|nr:hypothetical protein [Candidatus Dormibacteraeota bacterium]